MTSPPSADSTPRTFCGSPRHCPPNKRSSENWLWVQSLALVSFLAHRNFWIESKCNADRLARANHTPRCVCCIEAVDSPPTTASGLYPKPLVTISKSVVTLDGLLGALV